MFFKTMCTLSANFDDVVFFCQRTALGTNVPNFSLIIIFIFSEFMNFSFESYEA